MSVNFVAERRNQGQLIPGKTRPESEESRTSCGLFVGRYLLNNLPAVARCKSNLRRCVAS